MNNDNELVGCSGGGMSVAKSLFSDKVQADVLKNLFAVPTPEEAKEQLEKTKGESSESDNSKTENFEPPTEKTDGGEESEDNELAQAEAKDISAEAADGSNVQIDHIIQKEDKADSALISKADLVQILETFVTVVMEGKSEQQPPHANLPMTLHSDRSLPASVSAMMEGKNAEINELKGMLVEAQGTIIKLLTDRVEDRTKIATLESELRLLPDVQKGLDQSRILSINSENMRRDLSKVKAELDRLKIGGSESDMVAKKRSAWSSFRQWVAGADSE
jgi:hypothetical protein